jgi:hypothetical protein
MRLDENRKMHEFLHDVALSSALAIDIVSGAWGKYRVAGQYKRLRTWALPV